MSYWYMFYIYILNDIYTLNSLPIDAKRIEI